MATYNVHNMRVVLTKGKTAVSNPDRWATVYGTFYSEKGEELSIAQKEITFEMVQSNEFALDPVAGTLTIPSGKRGARAKVGMTAEEIAAELALLRGEETDPEPEPEPPTKASK